MKLKRYIFLIGLFLLALILYKINLENLVTILKSTNIFLIVFALSINIPTIMTMVLRWKRIISVSNLKISFKNTLFSYLKGALWGTITPGKIGELYRAKYLKEETKTSIGIALSTVVIERIFDIFFLLILGFIGILILSLYALKSFPILSLSIALVAFCLLLYLFMNEKWIRSILKPIFNIIIPKKHKEKIEFHFDEFYKGLKSIKLNTYVICAIYTLIICFLNSFMLYLLSLSLALNVSFWFMVIALPIITLINLIPISISGLGTSQAAFIFLFAIYDVSSESAVALSFLFMIFANWFYVFPGAILYIYLFFKDWRYKTQSEREKHN
jgi:uncharacterized protein (TIRG00374 family)